MKLLQDVQHAASTRLFVYTMSNVIFGMMCSGLGPAIPWLAAGAHVQPELLGFLPAAQAVMQLFSASIAFAMPVPRSFQHIALCCMMIWLGDWAGSLFALLPMGLHSFPMLVIVWGVQVAPRPWVGQLTQLLVSELYDDISLSSAAQSINQGGLLTEASAFQMLKCYITVKMMYRVPDLQFLFRRAQTISGFALGCVLTTVSHLVMSNLDAFYLVGASSCAVAVLFLLLPPLKEPLLEISAREKAFKMPSLFTRWCALLGVLSVGVEVACGTWIIEVLREMHFSRLQASLCNVWFWILFAGSRLLLAPLVLALFAPEPETMVIHGAAWAAASCIPAWLWPNKSSIILAVAGIAIGNGPAFAMLLSMAKQNLPSNSLTASDSALFSLAASVGVGVIPFQISFILRIFGPGALFPTFLVMCTLLVVLTKYVSVFVGETSETSRVPLVPPIVWMYWEQGWDSAPDLAVSCAKSWELANPGLKIRRLCKADLQELCPQLSETLPWDFLWELPVNWRSDVLRLSLLESYGGLWVDATCFCTASVMPWLENLSSSGSRSPQKHEDFFFVFHRDSNEWHFDPFQSQNLLISTWFIAASKGHPLCSAWLRKLCEEFHGTGDINYFAAHHSYRTLVEQDSSMARFRREIPVVSAQHPHALEYQLGFSAAVNSGAHDAAVEALMEALSKVPMQKLSHKVLDDNFLASTLQVETSLLHHLFKIHGMVPKDLTDDPELQLLERETSRKKKLYDEWPLYPAWKSLVVHSSASYGTMPS